MAISLQDLAGEYDKAAREHVDRRQHAFAPSASNGRVQTAEIFIAYAPRGAGLRCALAHLRSERDVYGWFTGPRHDTSVASCYFLLEDYYRASETRYEAVDQAALHSDWSLDEARRHELARMQEVFTHEWLCYRDDPRVAAELEAYAEAELATGELNLRFARLDKLSKLQPNWTFYSPGFERSVLRQLGRHWPLEYHVDEPVEKRRAAGPRP
jgi:hypothetical protein